uniref:Uncharacterized protein n=1 Tax=Setaria italica TaxID=4555 RepID=K3XP23_SETIT
MCTQSLQNNLRSIFFCGMCHRTLTKLTPPFTTPKQLHSNLQFCSCPSSLRSDTRPYFISLGSGAFI